MHLNLQGELALVTGASRGIGRAIALTLGQAGATVIGTATTESGAEQVTHFLKEHQITGIGALLDLQSIPSIEGLITQLNSQPPSILVNNAGITRDALLMKMSDQDWEQVITTNLTGVYRLTKALIRPMIKARHGRIITCTSLVALTGNAGQANYAAAKAGVIAFSKSLAKEVGGRGITVNTVAPGLIETDMTQRLPESQRQQLLQQVPLGRPGQADEVAAAVLFLASKAAAYITGETLHVNGGLYMA